MSADCFSYVQTQAFDLLPKIIVRIDGINTDITHASVVI